MMYLIEGVAAHKEYQRDEGEDYAINDGTPHEQFGECLMSHRVISLA